MCDLNIYYADDFSQSNYQIQYKTRERVSHNMGLTFQITSKCKDHFATLAYKNAKNRYYCPE